MSDNDTVRSLDQAAPALARILRRSMIHRPARHGVGDIRIETVMVAMRDGTRLATDLYLPPVLPAPVVAMRTPYGRAADPYAGMFLAFARRGYAVVAQDCRGTGDSEPDAWDYYMFESEDGYDFVDWIAAQPWHGGFIGATGSSYVGQTQWCMARHPAMSAIAPEVSGLGIATSTVHLYMFQNAYALSVGKGDGKLPVHYTELEALMVEETMAGGYYNDPLDPSLPPGFAERYPELGPLASTDRQRRLWEIYAALASPERAVFVREAFGVDHVSTLEVERLPILFGHGVAHDAHTVPAADRCALARSLHAPPLLITGWYDWGINDTLATWTLLRREAEPATRDRVRLLITPSAHNLPGYHEGIERDAALQHNHRTANNVELLLHWYEAVQTNATADWPRVVYYLMGANCWCAAGDWPLPDFAPRSLYLASDRRLSIAPEPDGQDPDRFIYDPDDATPTVGGSIVSYVYPPGSVDVAAVQERDDVLVYETPPLADDLDVVGPITLLLHASSSATDTDFVGRLSDVFPDGRSIQLQSGILRARYRGANPELLEPRRIYAFEIDLWATANRFKAGHRIRLDIASADFPHYDRNSNRGGEDGPPQPAHQAIYHGAAYPSCLVLCTPGGAAPVFAAEEP